jgi:hypothetical protein
LKSAAKLALEALKQMQAKANFECWNLEICDEAIKALEEALAKQEQGEPDYWLGYGLQAHTEKPFNDATPLYATPQQRTWVGLTDEDEIDWEEGGNLKDLVKAIDAKLREKNT